MVIVGLLLVVLAIVVVVAVVLNGNDPAQIDMQWFTFKTDVTGIFAAGALTLLVGVVGLSLLVSGLKRARRKRAEVNALKARAASREPAARPVPATQNPRASAIPSRSVPASSSGSASSSAGGAGGAGRSDTTTGASAAPPPGRRPIADSTEGDGTDEYFKSAPRDQ